MTNKPMTGHEAFGIARQTLYDNPGPGTHAAYQWLADHHPDFSSPNKLHDHITKDDK